VLILVVRPLDHLFYTIKQAFKLTSDALLRLIGVFVYSEAHTEKGSLMPLLLDPLEDLRTILRIIDDRISELSLRVEETLCVQKPIGVIHIMLTLLVPSVSFQALLEVQWVREIRISHRVHRGTS
jgi:hypothetical protein